VYDRVAHLETAHDVWPKLCNTYAGSSEIKSSRRDTYNRQYQTFSQKPAEFLDDCFARFESIASSLCSCGPLAYTDNERAKQLLYTLDDSVRDIKITALEESADFATLDTVSYPVPRKRERSLHTCAQDVQITRTVTI
jgi:hypothetical protein